MPEARSNKTDFNIVHFNIRRKLDIFDTVHDFTLWLRTASNSEDMN